MTWLDNSRILAILAVIILHVAGFFVTSTDIGSHYWWFGSIYDAVARWCVPVFVMISGALLLDRSKQDDLLVFYRKRMSRILWPIVFWTLFYLLWVFLKNLAKGIPTPILPLLKPILWGKPFEHLWFLYMILGLYVFTPFFRKVVAHSTQRELFILVLLSFSIAAAHTLYKKISFGNEEDFFGITFLYYTPYFFMGHLIRCAASKPSAWLLWLSVGFSCLATELGCYFVGITSSLGAGLYFYDYLSVTVIPMSISVMYLLKTWQLPVLGKQITERVAGLTLGIYLIHPVMIEVVIYVFPISLTGNPLLIVPIMTLAVFAMSLVAAWIISVLPYFRRVV